MRNTKYDKIANMHKASEDRLKNGFIAFVVGGLIGVLAELIIEVLCECFHISRSEASTFMIIIFIFRYNRAVSILFLILSIIEVVIYIAIPYRWEIKRWIKKKRKAARNKNKKP